METFGHIIASERRERRLGLKNIAEQIIKADGHHISVAYLDNLEKDLRTPSPELILEFARVLELPVDLLYCALGLFPLTFCKTFKLVISFFLPYRSSAKRSYLMKGRSKMIASSNVPKPSLLRK